MKKILILSFTSFLFLAHLNAQEKLKGNKIVTLQSRDVTYFNSILIKDNLKVFINESPNPKVSVETDENLQNAIKTRISDGVLEVYISQPIRRKKKLNVYIGVTDSIQRIEARSNASIIGENEIHTGDIELVALDNGSIKMNFNATSINIIAQDRSDLQIGVSTKGEVDVTSKQTASVKMQVTCSKFNAIQSNSSMIKPVGNCEEVIVVANDNANFKGKDLLADYATVNASDKSDVYVNIAKELIVNIENTAKLYIYDNPMITIEKFSDKSTLFKK
jgi:hypothetical protein